MSEVEDPVLAARARVSTWVRRGMRVGYGLWAVSLLLFFGSLIAGFSPFVTNVITLCLLGGSAILAPSIIFSYAVKAANRADRDGTW